MFANRNKGFTLIELLVVIAIIGILSSVVLASLNSARTKSRDARRIGDMKQLQLALEMYYDTEGSYASSTAALAPNYIPSVPTDPKGVAYSYGSAAGDQYTLGTVLETSHSVLDNDIDTDRDGVSCDQPLEYCIQP